MALQSAPSEPIRGGDDHDAVMKTPDDALLGMDTLPVLESELSDEEDGFEAGDAESIVGVSVSREQSRLKAPNTPAAEKSAVLDRRNSWGFFAGVEEDDQQEVVRNTLQNTKFYNELQAGIQQAQLDGGQSSDRKAEPSSLQTSPQDGYMHRPRNSVTNFLDSGKKMLSNLSFPSLPEPWTLRSRSHTTGTDLDSGEPLSHMGRSDSFFLSKLSWASSSPWSQNTNSPSKPRTAVPQELTKRDATTPAIPPQSWRARSLRKTVSDDSLIRSPMLSRQTTAGSVLAEDDALEWEHVKQQVNSRRKAIKDSISDSLPQLPNINLSNLRPEMAWKFLRDMDASMPKSASVARLDDFQAEAAQPPAAETRSNSPPKVVQSRTPCLDAALEQLTGDVVVLGGYRGSVLRSAEPGHRQLWVPVKVGLGVRKVNLEVPLNHQGEEDMHNSIFASGMLTHIGPVDMSRRLFKRLRQCANARNGSLKVWDYGYDWRLSPHLLSRRLIQFFEGLDSNSRSSKRGVTVIAHSLGGLIIRHAVNQRPELFAGVIYAGTPQHCVNILGPLRNGDHVLLSSKVLTAQVNFTFRTSFLLLPESGYCFFDKETKKQYHVDFFDADSWKRHALSPCIAPSHTPFRPEERKSIFGSLSNSFPSRLYSATARSVPLPSPPDSPKEIGQKAENLVDPEQSTVGMQMSQPPALAIACNIPFDDAMAYLRRTLGEVMQFKKELRHNSELEASNRYPPHALVYSTGVPTVYGARVASRDAIKHADAYDDLAFASGDGVVLARAAMMPRGYKTVEGGRVMTDRGHVALLGDLEAVGKCLLGLLKAREQGVGSGTREDAAAEP